MLLVAVERTQIGFVRTLQLAFQTNSQFKWDQDPERTGITILRQWPKREVKLPAIIVRAGPGDALNRTIGDNIRKQVTTSTYLNGATREVPTSLQFGGGFEPTINIEVYANDTITRDRILDWITIYIAWFFKDKFRGVGIEFNNMRFQSPREDQLGNDLVYISGLDIDLYTEWNHTVTIEDANRLNAITISNLFIINYDGSTIAGY